MKLKQRGKREDKEEDKEEEEEEARQRNSAISYQNEQIRV
tara:strand:- start:389 stop:508 length:120 start_codon:yes stop_codon:yes gene_type:complete